MSGHEDRHAGRRMARSRRAAKARADAAHEVRDMTPAVGKAGEPASWERAQEGAPVALHIGQWEDGRWSYLFGEDTQYAAAEADEEAIVAASRAAREGPPPALVQGPMMKAPVWTWEVPVYFWFGGMAAGASFVALACDLAGDERSARIARRVAVAALGPSPPLLVMDLGRPERFYNMLRIFKVRSPMSMGAWALSAFGGLATAAAGADLLGRRRTAKALGAANAVVGGYLGSYTGVLLASTAVPVWARSRLFLGPIFVATATLTGASTTRLVLVASGLEEGHPTREALGRVESGAMVAELLLSEVNERRLGRLASVLEEGEGARWFKRAKWLARAGMGLRFARRRGGPWTHHVASCCYLAAALCFRFAWVRSGPSSAGDDEAVARMARAHATAGEPDADVRVVHHR
ncbi:NrfD/PsrC family molybdoenzyme membrane anchor subunit [Conexibacter sp. SYSU D00693]|uniref:NrfD/PsrC family molybdoenzyme membrane anchor subunit n=1 Tax=Conexibacter sp. SYSU D00693 TaxID=2812560 RepID=UPI00196AF752|nr:NrfD/PsrC family molybdoenzyme membrane anchor subunit [Conexibacter sp. SYSU D00693]